VSDEITTGCVNCGEWFTEAEVENATCCPKCGNAGVPMSPKENVTVEINWHELRILCIWAENHARRIEEKAVYAIADRLQQQHPSKTPLTLSGELRQIGEKYKVEASIPLDGPLPPKIS
jgi:predicted  nucleic acid-binding Zn-ribbon protein